MYSKYSFFLFLFIKAGALTSSYASKVPKREIFDRLDFPDFYTMKSLRVGDFGVKIRGFI